MKKLKSKKGSAYVLIFFCFYTFLVIYILSVLGLAKYKIAVVSEILDNALTTSNLSVFSIKNLDQDFLSQSPSKDVIIIKDPNVAMATWKKHIKYNFGLNNDYTPKYSTSFIKSKIDIKTFIIYNVDNITNDITEYKYNSETGLFSEQVFKGAKGTMKTENGNIINVTTVDSEVGFNLDIIFNKTQYVTIARDAGVYKKN